MTDEPPETGWLPSTPVDDTLIRSFLHAQAAVDDDISMASGGRIDRTDDVALADSGGPLPFFNQSVLFRPVADPGDRVLDVVDAFYDDVEGRGVALLSAWPTPDLTARGWSLIGHPAMVVRSPGAVPDTGRWAQPAGVEVTEASTPDEIAIAERVFIDGYPLPWAAGAEPGTVLSPAVVDAGVSVRVARVDGEPAAVGLRHTAHGLVSLCGGATLSIARRRGAWAALVRARVLDDPGLPAVAYTSDYSRPGFITLGFLPITRFTLWGRGW